MRAAARLLAALSLVAASCTPPRPEADRAAPAPPASASSMPPWDPIAPVPPVALDGAKVALGERLFDDPILSGDGLVACASCHLHDKGYADGRARAAPAGRPEGKINVPTMLDVGLWPSMNWTGKFASIEEHNDALIGRPDVMATSWADCAARAAARPDYVTRFGAVYRDGVTAANVRDALVAYERSLVALDAPFDRYLRGEAGALSDEAREGFFLFRDYGCVSCHQGVGVGGNMFQKFGVMRDYFADRGSVTEADLGRFSVTREERDRHVFRVPSLRNVELTAPYFHDGSAATLEEAIRVMARYQLGRPLADGQVGRIAAFLRSLTGVLPARSP